MELSKNETEEIIAKLQNTPGMAACLMCGKNNWSINGFVISMKPIKPTVGKAMPVVALMCSECGYTWFVNALMLGIEEDRLK